MTTEQNTAPEESAGKRVVLERIVSMLRLISAGISSAIIGIIVWCLFCYLADYQFHLGANAWRMWFGYTGGAIVVVVMERVFKLIR
jgi:hypothetical protein